MLLNFLHRLKTRRRKARSLRDRRKFFADVREVMSMRIAQGLTGRLSADEAHRMVVEKQTAAMRAQLAYVQHLLEGDPHGANTAVYDIYDRTVQSNRKRLNHRRWRWLFG